MLESSGSQPPKCSEVVTRKVTRKNVKKNLPKQKTLTTTMFALNNARVENIRFRTNFVRWLAVNKIPFNVADTKVTEYFAKTHIRAGEAIPKSKALLHYLEGCAKVDREKLKKLMVGTKINMFFDETSDSCGRFVWAILFTFYSSEGIPQKPVLVELLMEKTPGKPWPSCRNGFVSAE